MWPGPASVIGGAASSETDDYSTQPCVVPTMVAAHGIWRPDDAAFYLNNSFHGTEWPTVPDPSFSSVAVCLHFNRKGQNGNLRMLPTSRSPNDCDGREVVSSPVTGIAQHDHRQGGLYSMLCNSSSWIIHNVSNSITLGTGDWTLEGFVYCTSNAAGAGIWDFRTGTGDTVRPLINLSGTVGHVGQLTYFRNGDKINDSVTLSTNTWHHIAACRNSNTVYLYKDGVSVGSVADSTNMTAATSITLGSNVAVNAPFPGYLDEFRCTVGVARYPGGTTFTVPTVPFPDY